MRDEADLHLAEQALRQLRSTVVPVEDTERVEQRRPRLLAALEREIRAVPVDRARRLRRRRTALGMVAAAAVVVLAWGTVRLTNGPATKSPMVARAQLSGAQLRNWSGDVSLGPPGQQRGLESSGESAPGTVSFLSTRRSGWVELELPGAVRVEVSAETELQVLRADPNDRHVRLARGRLDVQVPKPEGGAVTRLVVSTPDAQVEVRGTVFSVEVKPGRFEPSVTEVVVSRGAVVVRHGDEEVRVPAGSRWSSEREPALDGAAKPERQDGDPLVEPSSDSGAEPRASKKQAVPSVERSAGHRPPQGAGRLAASPSSTLAEQNRLFERALVARDRGSWREVVELCDRFLNSYPDSTLIESVKTERARAAQRLSAEQVPSR